VLPAEPFSLEKLNAANADVHFRGEKILTENMLLSKMNAHLTVNDGVLKLAPLDFGIAGGNLVSLIEMDGRHLPYRDTCRHHRERSAPGSVVPDFQAG
jgi:uncharacterized protein involved in outer membrane biogenesis